MDEGRKLLIGTNLASEQLIECQALTFLSLSLSLLFKVDWSSINHFICLFVRKGLVEPGLSLKRCGSCSGTR
uniref:Uncharacterized protein n=1 Tax=Picea glauca TaxID=3330 RepID=A0A101M316_PICGL|nr:hypothetical protein ABT39_MTgene3267 [Picea glauca]QHR89231.1 hypothetical protein Q903MT_gene3251 [Picea sitchensis]